MSFDTARIRGSHGNTGPGYEIAWATSLPFEEKPATVMDLARLVQRWTQRES